MGRSLKALHQVAVHSSDLERSVDFNRDRLGADFIAKFDPPGLAFFRLGETRILLERNAPPAMLYFRVEDIDGAAESLRARGVVFDGAPSVIHRDKDGLFGPAGAEEWMVFFRDPDDNVLALASQRMPD